MRKKRTCSTAVGAFAVLVCLFVAQGAFAQDWMDTTCDRGADEGQDACDATPFLSAIVGSTTAESFHYTTDHTLTTRRFDYGFLGGPSSNPFSLYNSPTVENGLFHTCYGAAVAFPRTGGNIEPRDYVTFVFGDFGPSVDGVNFLAVNQNGQIIDEATKQNPQAGFEVVTLGPHPGSDPSYDIAAVYMWHVQSNSCDRDCAEPAITEVRACDVRFP